MLGGCRVVRLYTQLMVLSGGTVKSVLGTLLITHDSTHVRQLHVVYHGSQPSHARIYDSMTT